MMIFPDIFRDPPRHIRGGYRPFAKGGTQLAGGATYSHFGIRAAAPFGAFVFGVFAGGTGATWASVRIGNRLFSVAPTDTCYRRDGDGTSEGKLSRAVTKFFIGVAASIPGGAGGPGVLLVMAQVSGNVHVEIPVMAYVPKDWDLVFTRELQNIDLRGSIYGVEFLTPEARDWFRERML